uniref:Uncharacterized protein n=1 Tax=Oryza sativa subsp. japonica TaxID=39947 RepID=Q5VN25_ORYSJ|nr:hypothetical protein [Oryza sativa Japonica Group]
MAHSPAAAAGGNGERAESGGARGREGSREERGSSSEGWRRPEQRMEAAATAGERTADGRQQHLKKGRRGVRDGEDDRDDQSGRPEMDENGELTSERGKRGIGGDWWQPRGGRGAGGLSERDGGDCAARRRL